MSNSGYRGRSFGPRGARTNGPANGFNGPRFPHPNFNHPRPPHRLSGHDKWIERPNFAPWQQNKNFHPHPQYRGNLQYRSNNRGRAVSGRGIIRFSGPGRPPALQYGIGFIRNPVHRTLSPEEQVEDRPALISQTPLLGSEEERQQKILETADKLKQKLSSITEEELTNFWEDDLSVLPNNNSEEENSPNKGIPELRHEPPELDLTFTDFRDIGRVDCNNSKFENVDSKSNNDISINFEQKSTDDISISTNDDITIVDENKEEFVITLDSTYDKDDQDQSSILLEDDRCFEQVHNELPNFECNIENLQLRDDDVTEDFIHSESNDVDRNASALNLNENIKNVLPIESIDNLVTDKPSSVNNVETISVLPLITNDQDRLQVDFLQNQNNVQLDIRDTNVDIIQDANIDVECNEHTETKLPEDNQIRDSSQTSICQDETHKNVVNLSDAPQNKPSNFLPSNEETHSSTICDSSSPSCSTNYNEVHKANDDKKLNNSLVFQPRVFNIPTRFTQRAAGSRCRWTFQQNGKNLFFRGPQRLPFLGNRMPTPRHVLPFKTPDLVPVGFDPRAPPPFSHNVPVSSHDSQHKVTVPFSSNDLPPAFDPSEPPPNIRSKSGPEPSNVQEKSMTPLVNTPQSNLNVTIQPLPAFDPRGPPPRILPKIPGAPSEKLPEFNPQQPPPKIHKREETFQPPPIFDPRLSSHERSSLIAPLDTPRGSMMPLNLMETSPVADFSITSVTPVFSQLPPINIPAPQPFISNMQINFPSVLPNGGQGMITEFPLPPPSMTMAEVPPPPPKELSMEISSNLNQNINMDDGLEDMQEAMEFAKQIMNMTEETKNNDESSVPSELAPLEIPVPTKSIANSSTVEKERVSTVKKERKKENRAKRNKQNVICGPELILEKQEEVVIVEEEKSIEDRRKNTEDALLSSDQIRPKVVFNLNTKTKKIQKPEEWQKTPINEIRILENRETFQSSTTQRFNKQRVHSRQHPIESRRSNTNQNKNQQKENGAKKNTAPSVLVSSTVIHEKLSDACYHHKNYTKDSEKLHLYSSKVELVNNLNTQKNQRSRKETRKEKLPVSESSWKNRVISRFLKMSKNDICNMVNNSSLRKFDIAMKHLVKERRSSLSLEMRNTEDERMKEYDREEFMNQLNAMLDPSAVVGITDLPTEFIHHLSEVLQLDSMPCDADIPETRNSEIDQVQIVEKDETSRVYTSEYSNEENPKVQSFPEYLEPKNMYEKHVEEQLLRKEEPVTHQTLNAELNLNILREDTSSSHRSLSNKINPEMEGTHKKQQQPLFNEADLDDILSEVTGKTKNLSNLTTTMKPIERTIETHIGSSLMQTEAEEFGYNTFSRVSNKTAADLDDIFSAGIARVKLLGKTNVDHSDNLRIRKSSSEDRNTFRPEKYEKWYRKEREDPDMFRNLTKEEWEAKYGSMSITTAPTTVRKCVSNSSENLNKDNKDNHTQRHCSSDSPTRRLSVSPLSYETSAYDFAYTNEMEEFQRAERSETSSDSSSSSSSDTDQETAVAPNVTKLLKVIKQKEKIAKKRSINETIRDEVTAEIEKKWKEKSKHKERKSCKRERRKRDKKERRRKEKRKKRRRNSYSESSRSEDRTEGSRLLTEDEIKKEVIIKEEPVATILEENVASNINNTCVASTLANKTVHLQIEYQCSQVEKEQRFLELPAEKEVPAVTCDTASSQTKSKPVIVSVMVQPKTKAQLKQMPEPIAAEQKELIEKVAEVANNSAMNEGNEKMEAVLETNKYNESGKSNNKWVDTISPVDVSLQQINVSSNVKEPLLSNQSDTEVISHDNTVQTTTLACSTSNPAAEVSTNNEYADKKTSTTISVASNSTTESKVGGYKKIDIKAYKERALQRRLKEQAMLKGDDGGKSVSLTQDLQATLPVNKSNIKSLSTTNEANTIGTDANKVQLKDLRSTRFGSTSALLLEEFDKEIKATANLDREDRPVDVTQKTKESLIPMESRTVDSGNSKTSVIRPVDSALHIFNDPMKHKEYKRNNKSSSQEKVAIRELNESVEKEKSRSVSKERKLKPASEEKKSKSTPEERKSKSTTEERKSKPAPEEKKLKSASEEKKLKKQISADDFSKFKYIRSEGSKELKLKKEKTRRPSEKSKKNSASKPTDPKSSIAEKHVETHSHKNTSKDNQESPIVNKNTIEVTQTEIEKTNSRDTYENLSVLRITCSETCSDPEWAINNKTIQEKTNIHSAVKQNEEQSNDLNVKISKEVIVQVSKTIPPIQPAADQQTATAESSENLTNSGKEENAVQQVDKDAVKATAINASFENTSTENLSKQNDIYENVLSMGSIFNEHSQSDSTDEYAETIVSPVPRGESHSLSERINVDIEKSGHTINIKDLKNVSVHNNISLPLKGTVSQVVDENDSTNTDGNEENVVKLTSELYKKVENSEECDSVTRNDVSSPDSPKSPFKGFLMDSIDNNICQLSPLYDVAMSNKSDTNDARKEPIRWLDASLDDKPALQAAEGDKNSKDSLKRTEEDNETMSTCNLVVENESMDQAADNNVNVTDNTKVDTIPLKVGKGETAETDGICDISADQKKSLSIEDVDNHDALDGNNESLIVLDKHTDDANGKSIEKLSALDLEDCIARDADVFDVEPLRNEENSTTRTESPNFNSIDFKELSGTFDKSNADAEQNQNDVTARDEREESVLSDEDTIGPPELFASEERLKTVNTANIVNSAPPFESSSKISRNVTKTFDSFIPGFPVASLQNVATTSSKDIHEKSATSELFIAEMKTSDEENRYRANTLRNNLQRDLEPFEIKNETLPKLSIPKESTTKILLQNAPSTASTSETSTECLKVNKQLEPVNKPVSVPSEARIRNDKDTSVRSTIIYDESKHLSKTSLHKSSQRRKNEALRKIKDKSKLKHKKEKRDISKKAIKEAVKSDIVNVNHPSTKEAIMARMIEIDVEIHKLMTEKMTLYQILTSNVNLPSDDNLQKNNTMQEEKTAETLLIRPRTPSVLMSQLIQNIETSPVKNQCAKTTMETLSAKDSSISAEQPNKSKTPTKHEHYTEKRGTSACGPDDGENVHHPEDCKSSASKKGKRQRSEKAVKKLESKPNSFASIKDAQNVATEKKQTNDAMKLMLKKMNVKETTMQQDSSQVSVNEAKLPEDTSKTFMQQIDKKSSRDNEKVEMLKRQEMEVTVESTESQTSTEEIVQRHVTELDDESYLMKDNEERIETLNEKSDANSSEKPSESRASERSSIYSDDSTWDSLFQHSNVDEQKRSSTGLALLEETYRREMAKTRKIKAAMRRKKKIKLQNLLETVNTITPDEEELPLSALYVKKLHQKKKLLSSFEQQAELQTDDDPQLWKNVVEVINAVAENRTEDLYVRPLGGRSTDDKESIVSDVQELEENSEFKRDKEEQTMESLASDTREASIKSFRDSENSCENKDDANNEAKKDNLQFVSCKSQEFLSDKHFQEDLEVTVSTEASKNLSGTSVCNTSTNTETNVIKPLSVQRTIENDNVETNKLTLIRDSDSSSTEINSNDVQSDRYVSNISENSDAKKIEEKLDAEVRETDLEQRVIDVEIELEKNAITREPTNSESVVTSGEVEKSYDELLESNSNKSTIVNEAASKEEPDTKTENMNEKKLQDSSVSSEKNDNVNNVYADSNYASQCEQITSVKEHKESDKGKEVEPSDAASNEENNNQNCASVSSATENAEMLRTDETSGKKLQKRKRENSKTSLRRSSRYTEESGKRIKVEADTNASNVELDVQEKNIRTQFPSVSSTSSSPCEEIETIWINTRKSRSQKPPNRKRGTPLPQDAEILCSNGESLKGIKRHKQHTMSELMNCMVKVIDCKHTILNPNVKPNVLQQYGISRVNTCVYSNFAQTDLSVSSIQSTSTEELSILYSKQTAALIESSQCQTSKSSKRVDDATQSTGEQINSMKVRKRVAKVDSSASDKEECINFDIEVAPVLAKESVTADTLEHCEKPDVEIVEERMMVTKNQQQSNSGSTLTVIDTTDDKEFPRTQYTVHKGPILDIKVFENSFLAASEDGRIYRYNQASNGILNIYKGHTAAVTCLYVYKTHSADINKEWMFSGSLDGTLRCYNIVTGVQVRDTADISSPIQCMDEAWGKIFIGTKSGHVSRYHVKSGIIKGNTIQFSDKSVLALKATNEGPRRVLIVASRSQPITIRDAQSGLFLRTICGQKSHTVYSLMRDNNLIYCGTSSTSIPVFDFTNGEQTMQYDAGVGIVCMRLYKQLLFAGCYDGNIYVFDTKDHRLICSIPGPGNMLLSMEVIDNKIIAGSKDKRLQSWQMPRQVRSLL